MARSEHPRYTALDKAERSAARRRRPTGNDPDEVVCDYGVSLSPVIDPLTESWWVLMADTHLVTWTHPGVVNGTERVTRVPVALADEEIAEYIARASLPFGIEGLGALTVFDTWSSNSRQHFIDTGRYLTIAEQKEF